MSDDARIMTNRERHHTPCMCSVLGRSSRRNHQDPTPVHTLPTAHAGCHKSNKNCTALDTPVQ